MKKEIHCLEHNITHWLEGDLKELTRKLLNVTKCIKEELKGRYNEAELYALIDSSHRMNLDRDFYYNSYDSDCTFTVQFYRYETDEEYKGRLEAEEKRKKAFEKANEKRKKTVKEKELQTLKRLKEKYEKVSGS